MAAYAQFGYGYPSASQVIRYFIYARKKESLCVTCKVFFVVISKYIHGLNHIANYNVRMLYMRVKYGRFIFAENCAASRAVACNLYKMRERACACDIKSVKCCGIGLVLFILFLVCYYCCT